MSGVMRLSEVTRGYPEPTRAQMPQNGEKLVFSSSRLNKIFIILQCLFCIEDEKRRASALRKQFRTHGVLIVPLHCEGRAWSRSDRCLPGILMAAAIFPAGPAWPMKSPGIILGISCAYMYFFFFLIVAILAHVEALICSRRILCIVGTVCVSVQ